MEIRLRGHAFPCIAQQDIKAGIAVKLGADATGNATGAFTSTSFNKGNIVQGASIPTSDDDTGARFIAAWPVSNTKPPIYQTLPTLDIGLSTVPYTLREFIEGSSNLPATDITLRMVDPRLQDEQTIPSGTPMLVYDEGVYTVTSGCFSGTSFTVGDGISVKGTTGNWYNSTSGQVASVLEYNSTEGRLTIKIEDIRVV